MGNGQRSLRAAIGLVVAVMVAACSAPRAAERPRTTPPVVAISPTSATPSSTTTEIASSSSNAIPEPGPSTLSLSGRDTVAVPHSDLTARISNAWHKTGAPVIGVSVLFTLAGDPERKAEVGWRIESGGIDSTWQPLEGQRFDDATQAYVDEHIPGWRVRLESIDDQSSGGSPRAITISVERASE